MATTTPPTPTPTTATTTTDRIPQMTAKRSRTIGVVLGVLSLAVFVPALTTAAFRLEGRPVPLVWFLDPILSHDFAYRGEPLHVDESSITQEDGTEKPAVVITYRGRDTLIPVETRDDRLPDLLKYENWMEILPMVEGGNARSAADIERMLTDGEIQARLIVATRQTPVDYDPGSWGLVRRKDWRYTFYEFVHDVPVEESVRVFEGTYRELEGLVDPDVRAEQGREGDLWMYHAMIQVTPANYYPKNKQVDESIAAMGWAWPAAGVSMLGMVAGVMIVLMSSVRTPDEESA